jgi:hypothetical protein
MFTREVSVVVLDPALPESATVVRRPPVVPGCEDRVEIDVPCPVVVGEPEDLPPYRNTATATTAPTTATADTANASRRRVTRRRRRRDDG